MRATLDAIVTKFKYPNARKSAEPTYTLELTGKQSTRQQQLTTLTTHHSPLTTYHSPLTAHHSPLTAHH